MRLRWHRGSCCNDKLSQEDSPYSYIVNIHDVCLLTRSKDRCAHAGKKLMTTNGVFIAVVSGRVRKGVYQAVGSWCSESQAMLVKAPGNFWRFMRPS